MSYGNIKRIKKLLVNTTNKLTHKKEVTFKTYDFVKHCINEKNKSGLKEYFNKL